MTRTALPVTRDLSLNYLCFVGGGGDDVLSQVDFLAWRLVGVGKSLRSFGPWVFEDIFCCGSLGGIDVETAGQQICQL